MIQAIANMAVNVNLFPVTGVTLPDQYGWQFVFVHMSCYRYYFKCSAVTPKELKEKLRKKKN